MKFEYYKSKTNTQWYFRIVARNGKIIAASEGYKNRNDCLSTIDLIKRLSSTAPFVLVTEEKPKED